MGGRKNGEWNVFPSKLHGELMSTHLSSSWRRNEWKAGCCPLVVSCRLVILLAAYVHWVSSKPESNSFSMECMGNRIIVVILKNSKYIHNRMCEMQTLFFHRILVTKFKNFLTNMTSVRFIIYTANMLLEYDVIRHAPLSVVMDAGSRIVNFIVNFIRNGTVFA